MELNTKTSNGSIFKYDISSYRKLPYQSIFIRNNFKNNVIVSFAGCGEFFDFVNFLNNEYKEYDHIFIRDLQKLWYHNGILGYTETIEETIIFLKDKLSKYNKIIFIGISAGGYGSILYGSLLNIDIVLTFIPLTNLTEKYKIMKDTNDLRFLKINHKYINLRSFINNKTNYIIYGGSNISLTDISHKFTHCENLMGINNVEIFDIYNVEIKKMRDSGVLKKIFLKHINI